MKTRTYTRAAIAVALMSSVTAIGTAANAQDASIPSDWELSGNVGLYSDYRFRGISFTDDNMAIQGGLDLAHSSGFYVGTWGSNLGGFGTFGDPNLELDVYGGYGGDLGGVGSFDIGVLYYLYPGASGNNDYIEFYGSVGAEFGPVGATLGLAWAPDQDSIGDDNVYVYGDLGTDIPGTPISLGAHLGYTDGSLGFGGAGYGDNYLDWSISASTEVYGLEFGLAYIDTDISKTRENVLGTRATGGSGDPYVADRQFVVSLGYSF